VNEKISETDKENAKLNDPNRVQETEFNDVYGTVRLISPKMGRFKVYISKTIGSVSKIERNKMEQEVSKKSENYEGYGAGVRFYFKPKWSMHGEHMRLNYEDTKTHLKRSDDRFQVGFSYEF
jgi:hypothetical protein